MPNVFCDVNGPYCLELGGFHPEATIRLYKNLRYCINCYRELDQQLRTISKLGFPGEGLPAFGTLDLAPAIQVKGRGHPRLTGVTIQECTVSLRLDDARDDERWTEIYIPRALLQSWLQQMDDERE